MHHALRGKDSSSRAKQLLLKNSLLTSHWRLVTLKAGFWIQTHLFPLIPLPLQETSCGTCSTRSCFAESLPFQKIQHSITAQDHQPTPDSCILSMVVGQLKADEDPIMGFHQIFLLKNINDAWVCTNDMFRLALHNFG
ncbi:nuclear transport factor 2 isoform X1 [Falco biarmicus]|uniref:nuclear transport factor 2 isoform X1 n=1 Tax=Falco peregrinus TaxID=8954 RepID=UPI000FFBD10D|nr:nuclear transport factor 2 isoform X1 [Falco peregrinus]XP_027662658.1 nuclear transport factor 2 isoform X1 [Falco cherrug]XP_037264882.1 nuclear transport factor 2 isoform X1 [Falco rusticolus]XP_056217001.1 nuclear transport factor 2 isoform X1 [Falco biarmicus]